MCTIGRCESENESIIFCNAFSSSTIMIQIPTNEQFHSDYEIVVKEVLSQLTTGCDKYGEGQVGTAYIDWGIINDTYKNCSSKNIADKVANDFKTKGYYVYIQRMGFGNKRIPEGTPTCYRIYEKPRQYTNWDEL